jgi:hypothetical protein
MKLIYEIDNSPEYEIQEEINESTGQKTKKYKIKGVFSTIGEKNRNGRIYPRRIWETEVAKYQNVIKSGSLNRLCEWQHPARTSVDPMEAVAAIDKLEIVGNKVIGEATLLDNPKANQLKSLIDNGIKVSVSSRGVGKVDRDTVKDFKLITYDLVDTPSDFNATMDGMVESYTMNEGVLEGKEFDINENGDVVEVPLTESFTDEEIQNGLKESFSNFLNSLKSNDINEARTDPTVIKDLMDTVCRAVSSDYSDGGMVNSTRENTKTSGRFVANLEQDTPYIVNISVEKQ